MKWQKTMFSFLSASEGKKSRTETVTGNINFRGKENYIQGQATRNQSLHLPENMIKTCVLKMFFIHVKSAKNVLQTTLRAGV